VARAKTKRAALKAARSKTVQRGTDTSFEPRRVGVDGTCFSNPAVPA
jgi:hypothetical protein